MWRAGRLRETGESGRSFDLKAEVRFGSKADLTGPNSIFLYSPESGHREAARRVRVAFTGYWQRHIVA
jgi:hypothetical protein